MTEQQRREYLSAMGIEVWQMRGAIDSDAGDEVADPQVDPDLGQLWLMQYPGCLIALHQESDLEDLKPHYRALVDDLAVAVGERIITGKIAVSADEAIDERCV